MVTEVIDRTLDYQIKPLSEDLLAQLPQMTRGAIIIAVRKDRGMRQQMQLRKRVGISSSTFCQIEAGDGIPRPKHLLDISRVLMIDPIIIACKKPWAEVLTKLTDNEKMFFLRIRRGWRQEDLAQELERAGLRFNSGSLDSKRTTVTQWENGVTPRPEFRPIIRKVLADDALFTKADEIDRQQKEKRIEKAQEFLDLISELILQLPKDAPPTANNLAEVANGQITAKQIRNSLRRYGLWDKAGIVREPKGRKLKPKLRPVRPAAPVLPPLPAEPPRPATRPQPELIVPKAEPIIPKQQIEVKVNEALVLLAKLEAIQVDENTKLEIHPLVIAVRKAMKELGQMAAEEEAQIIEMDLEERLSPLRQKIAAAQAAKPRPLPALADEQRKKANRTIGDLLRKFPGWPIIKVLPFLVRDEDWITARVAIERIEAHQLEKLNPEHRQYLQKVKSKLQQNV